MMFRLPAHRTPTALLREEPGYPFARDPYASPGTRPLPRWAIHEIQQRIIAIAKLLGAPLPVYLSEDNAGILAAIGQVMREPVIIDENVGKVVDEFIDDGSDDGAILPHQTIFGQ
jgi:hypothetical protein